MVTTETESARTSLRETTRRLRLRAAYIRGGAATTAAALGWLWNPMLFGGVAVVLAATTMGRGRGRAWLIGLAVIAATALSLRYMWFLVVFAASAPLVAALKYGTRTSPLGSVAVAFGFLPIAANFMSREFLPGTRQEYVSAYLTFAALAFILGIAAYHRGQEVTGLLATGMSLLMLWQAGLLQIVVVPLASLFAPLP